MGLKTVNISLPDELLRVVDKHVQTLRANDEDMNRSKYVRRALKIMLGLSSLNPQAKDKGEST